MTSRTQRLRAHPDTEHNPSGERVVRALYRLTRIVKFHQDNNRLLIEGANEFCAALAPWWAEEPHLTIQVLRGRFFVQDVKLSYERESAGFIQELLEYFERRNLRGLMFFSQIRTSSPEEVLRLARLLNDAESHENPLSWLAQHMSKQEFPWVEIVQQSEVSFQDGDLQRKGAVKRTYAHALTSVKDVSEKIGSQRRAGVRKLKRVVQNMVDLLGEDEPLLVAVSTMRDYDDYTYTHSVNVAVLCLCLGRRIGLSRLALRRLGICGLVHDLGKVEIPHEILNKPGMLNSDEVDEIEKHPLRSVSQIIKLRSSRELKARIILPPFEHHLRYDLSGYPRVSRKKPLSLFGRILAIADVFDALTSPRVYRPMSVSPDRALAFMLNEAGKTFDPILMKVFANMLGVYPVGTLLILDTAEMGMVVEAPKNGEITRPRLILLHSAGQEKFEKGEIVDLADKGLDGTYKRSIVRSLHPSMYGIQPPEFIL
jgi:HD-GYP domain-containing protein (c-di-GMP phosphodiesterase class II)